MKTRTTAPAEEPIGAEPMSANQRPTNRPRTGPTPTPTDPFALMEVYSTFDVGDADIVRAALHGEGFKCVLENAGQGGLTHLGVSPVRVLVRAVDFDRARACVESWEQSRRG